MTTTTTATQLLASLRRQATTHRYEQSDDDAHFAKAHMKDVPYKIRVRVLIERAIVRRAVEDILAADDGAYCISVYDGEEYPLKRSRDAAAVMAEIGACDEEWLRVRFAGTESAPEGAKIGGIYLVYGNDGWDVIADHSTGELERLLEGANALADAFGEAL